MIVCMLRMWHPMHLPAVDVKHEGFGLEKAIHRVARGVGAHEVVLALRLTDAGRLASPFGLWLHADVVALIQGLEVVVVALAATKDKLLALATGVVVCIALEKGAAWSGVWVCVALVGHIADVGTKKAIEKAVKKAALCALAGALALALDGGVGALGGALVASCLAVVEAHGCIVERAGHRTCWVMVEVDHNIQADRDGLHCGAGRNETCRTVSERKRLSVGHACVDDQHLPLAMADSSTTAAVTMTKTLMMRAYEGRRGLRLGLLNSSIVWRCVGSGSGTRAHDAQPTMACATTLCDKMANNCF